MKIPFELLKPYTRFQYGDCLYTKEYDTGNIPYAQLVNDSLYLLLDKDYLYLDGNTLVDVEKDNLKCPLNGYNSGADMGCSLFVKREPEKCAEIVEKWAVEHPQKTILQEFLEKYPDARVDKRGIPPELCPDDLGYSRAEKCGIGSNICVKCWNKPLEEAK